MAVSVDYEPPPIVEPIQLSENTRKFLKVYDVHPIRGFLPSDDPDERLDKSTRMEYDAWESIISRLPELLSSGNARKEIKRLPICNDIMSTLKEQRESQVKRAMVVLSVLAQAYVFEDPNAVEDQIPACIAVPLCNVAEHLRVPPILSHMSIVLNNWKKIDLDGPLVVSNLESLCLFTQIKDEQHFYLSTVEIEAYGGPVIALLAEAQERIRSYPIRCPGSPPPLSIVQHWKEASLHIVKCLQYISKYIDAMREAAERIRNGCDPDLFYNKVRIFLQGSNSNPTLPSGVAYEGRAVDEAGMEKRYFYSGGSAAQSTIFAAIDAALGVNHGTSKVLAEARNYMPEKHRLFVKALEGRDRTNLSAFVLDLVEKSPELTEVERNVVEAYKSALEKLEAFRSYHIGLAVSYILEPSRKAKRASASCCCASPEATGSAPGLNSTRYTGSVNGTGGTSVMGFLTPLKDDVKHALQRLDM